jgi:hypothetical protein
MATADASTAATTQRAVEDLKLLKERIDLTPGDLTTGFLNKGNDAYVACSCIPGVELKAV